MQSFSTKSSPFCMECVKTFSNKKSLKKHLRQLHSKSGPVKVSTQPIYCNKCQISFIGDLRSHVLTHKSQEMNRFSQYSKTMSESQLKMRFNIKDLSKMDTSMPEEQIIRNKQQSKSSIQNDLMNTFSNFTEKIVCTNDSSDINSLKVDDIIQTAQYLKTVNEETMNIDSKSILQDQRDLDSFQSNTPKKDLRCGPPTKSPISMLVEEIFLTKDQSSTKSHISVESYKCKECYKTYTHSSYLREHMKLHTKPSFICAFCPKEWLRKGDLKQHERTHTGEKPFSCEYCKKSFSESSYLKRHLKCHTGQKDFKCKQCNKAFAQSGTLSMHLKVHTGEMSCQCSFCPKAFFQRGALNRHEKTHSGEKPFQCSQCSKVFALNNSLKKHTRIHTGEKPYLCSHCPKIFSRSHHLKRHNQVHNELALAETT